MEAGTDGQMHRLPHEMLGKSRELRLSLRSRSGDNQTGLLMKDADIPLAIEIVLVVDRLRAHQARERHLPRSGLANAGRNAHLERIVGGRLWRWFGRPVVII